jgi:hypothetical protein
MPSDLGPKPEPRIEPGEPNPGGVDAIDDFSGPIAIPDLSPAVNPAIEAKAPETVKQEVGEGEDTSTKATRDDHDPEDSEQESPA